MIRLLLLLSSLHLFALTANSQQDSLSPNFELRFLRAKFTDTERKKNIIIVFQLLAKNPKEFPPMLEPQLTYSVDDGPEKIITGAETHSNVNLQIFGDDLNEKDSTLYNYVKALLVQNSPKDLILAFYIENVSETGFKKMIFKYGLREAIDPSIRRVHKFEFTPEK
jgi:hypothetical protein